MKKIYFIKDIFWQAIIELLPLLDPRIDCKKIEDTILSGKGHIDSLTISDELQSRSGGIVTRKILGLCKVV